MITPFIGEVVLYAFDFAPLNWASCAGQVLPLSQNVTLFSLIGNEFGGNGITTFQLPNYRSLAPQGLEYCIALTGVNPIDARPSGVGEIAVLPYKTPASWFNCNGQLLQISQNNSLFQALGTRFGGDGKTTFGVPNLTLVAPPFPQGLLGAQAAPRKKLTAPGPTQSISCIAGAGTGAPAAPFMGEVRLFPTAAPSGWSTCAGQLLPINRNQALFSLLGLTFGGDGRMNFGLPNLSKVPLPSGLQYCIAVTGAFPPRS